MESALDRLKRLYGIDNTDMLEAAYALLTNEERAEALLELLESGTTNLPVNDIDHKT